MALDLIIFSENKMWGKVTVVGGAVAKAVSRWLPTATARLRARSAHAQFVVDKVGLKQIFSKYFRFPCQSSFHQVLYPHNQPGQVQ
jgi:hypothetical protein